VGRFSSFVPGCSHSWPYARPPRSPVQLESEPFTSHRSCRRRSGSRATSRAASTCVRKRTDHGYITNLQTSSPALASPPSPTNGSRYETLGAASSAIALFTSDDSACTAELAACPRPRAQPGSCDVGDEGAGGSGLAVGAYLVSCPRRRASCRPD